MRIVKSRGVTAGEAMRGVMKKEKDLFDAFPDISVDSDEKVVFKRT